MKTRPRIPFWKKILSYFTEVVLEHASSHYNKSLTVSLEQGRLQLSTRNAIYSYEDKYENFYQTFKQMSLPDKAHLLLLGFGLGSIPFMLEKKLGKSYQYTGVEIDDTVIHLASKYVLPDLKSDIVLIQADALIFVEQDPNKYDIISMDIFISQNIPEPFETRDFLESLQENLTPGGVLLFNRLAKTDSEKAKTDLYYRNIFLPVFPSATFIPVKGNHVLVSDKNVLK